jgi:hypothetical protein
MRLMNMNALSQKLLFLLSFIFFLLSFSCEKDFSAISKKIPNNKPDTTSHDFAWTIDTIGIYPSYLMDIAMIDETGIWAVGEIHTSETDKFDSLSKWIPLFNAVHWGGQQWELIRIPVKIYNTNSFVIGELQAVHAFDSNDVWVTTGGEVIRFDGSSWGSWEFLFDDINDTTFGGVKKFWGTSSSDLWCVSKTGNIFHYDGITWQKLSSGTNIDLYDVWGSPEGGVIWACGLTDFVGTILLKITGTNVEKVYEDNDNWSNIRQDTLSGVLTSIWTNDPAVVYIMSHAGMYLASSDTRGDATRIWLNDDYLPGFPRIMRGQSKNDIFTGGDFSMIAHYNGKSWKIFSELQGRIRTRGVAIKENLVVAAGAELNSGRAIILRGER